MPDLELKHVYTKTIGNKMKDLLCFRTVVLMSALSFYFVSCATIQYQRDIADYKDEIAKLEAALSLDPDNADVWTRLSSAFIKFEQWDKAQLSAERALELEPDSPGVHFNLAMIYYKKQQGPKAVEHMQRAQDLYRQSGQLEWAGKARQNKELIIRKFKLIVGLIPENLLGIASES